MQITDDAFAKFSRSIYEARPQRALPGCLTRQDIATAICDRLPELSRREARDLLKCFIDEVSFALSTGERVKLQGFGIFHVDEKGERRGRNPRTGERAAIRARKIVKFKPSRLLKEKIVKTAP